MSFGWLPRKGFDEILSGHCRQQTVILEPREQATRVEGSKYQGTNLPQLNLLEAALETIQKQKVEGEALFTGYLCARPFDMTAFSKYMCICMNLLVSCQPSWKKCRIREVKVTVRAVWLQSPCLFACLLPFFFFKGHMHLSVHSSNVRDSQTESMLSSLHPKPLKINSTHRVRIYSTSLKKKLSRDF